jgi:hypothetical protein
MGVGTRQKRLAAGWFGCLAMAVQALLPLLLAAEIRLANAGEIPICTPAGVKQVVLPVTHQNRPGSSHHGGMAACPICQAVACGQALADTTTSPALSAPQSYETAAAFAPQHQPHQAFYHSPYRARGPPSSV